MREKLTIATAFGIRATIFSPDTRRNPNGSIGAGSRIQLLEMFGANTKFLINIHAEIVKLDEESYIHRRLFTACE